jgi:hypothetical protein
VALGWISAARFLARWHQRPQRLEREQRADQGHNRGVDRVSSGTLPLCFKWTDASRCHRSAQTGGFPAATFAGTCKAMIAQRRGRVSFCSAERTRSPGEDHCFILSAQDHSCFNRLVLLLFSPSFQTSSFNISRVSPGTVRADLAHGGGARSTVRRVKVAVGGLASLLQWTSGRGRAASGCTFFQAVRSFGCSSLWRQAYLGYSGRVGRQRGSSLTQYGWWNSQRGSLYTGDRNQPPQQSFLGGTVRSVRGQAQAEGPPGMSGVDSGRPSSAGARGSRAQICHGLRSGPSVPIEPTSRQQCYPFWSCNWTLPAIRWRPPAVVLLSKEWTGQEICPRLITLICVEKPCCCSTIAGRWQHATTLFRGPGRRTSDAQLPRGYAPTPGPTAVETECVSSRHARALALGG